MALQPSQKVVELLEALGYSQVDDDVSAFVGNYFSVLGMGAQMIEEESMKLKMLSMSEEDRKKQELIMQNRKEYLAKKKAELEYKK
jgi:hypothetical protein